MPHVIWSAHDHRWRNSSAIYRCRTYSGFGKCQSAYTSCGRWSDVGIYRWYWQTGQTYPAGSASNAAFWHYYQWIPYGDKLHEDKPHELEQFLRIIQDTCVGRKGKVIIPAFSVGRTQELVYKLDQLVNQSVATDPGFMLTARYLSMRLKYSDLIGCFDFELHRYLLKDADPFWIQ